MKVGLQLLAWRGGSDGIGGGEALQSYGMGLGLEGVLFSFLQFPFPGTDNPLSEYP